MTDTSLPSASAPRPPLARHVGWILLGVYLIVAVAALVLGFVNRSRFVADGPPTPDVFLNILAFVAWSAVGALLIYRQPRNSIGWLFAVVPLLTIQDQFLWGVVYYGAITRPGFVPGVEYLMIWQHWHGVVFALLPMSLLFSWFPTGRPLSPRWAIVNWMCAAALVVYLLAAAVSPVQVLSRSVPFFTDGVAGALDFGPEARAAVQPLTWAAYLTLILCTLASVASLLVRLSRATGVERQQLKWFVFAASLAAPGFFLLVLGLVVEGLSRGWIFLSGLWFLIANVGGIAIASAIAILRYRLYDIDLIIRRTLVYSLLTALLAGAYLGSVLVLQTVFQALTGESRGELVTVISTLTIAALFLPLRRRVQTAIDRRFYRRKYDAARVLSRFGGSVRDDVELEQLRARLLDVIHETMQPAHASLWVPPASPGSPASRPNPRR